MFWDQMGRKKVKAALYVEEQSIKIKLKELWDGGNSRNGGGGLRR